MNLETNDVEAGPREDVDHSAGAGAGKLEIVRLDQDQGLLNFGPWRVINYFVQNSAVFIGELCP